MRGTRGPDQEAGIILDWSWSSFSDEQCLLSVLLHEFGHLLGLDHQEDGTSIMFPATRCRPELSDADIAAVRFLYP
jgi:predicted Zn-dependent protease